MENIPNYRIEFDDIDNPDGLGLFGISLVDEPANEINFLKLSKDQVKLKVNDKEKQIVTGAVLIPNQKIFRKNESRGEHFIHFEEDVIERLSIDYFKKDADKNSWFNHDYDEKIEGNTVIESWLIMDKENDKANALGFDLPKGTWMMTTKLSDENWKKYVKTGKVNGYSIDAFLKHDLIKNKKEELEMKNLFEKFVKFAKSMEDETDKKKDEKEVLEDEKKDEKKEDKKDEKEVLEDEKKEDKKDEKEEMEDEPSLEEQKKDIREMIEADPEFKKILEEIFGKSLEEKVEDVSEEALKNENVKETLRKLFSKEIDEKKDSIEKLEKENKELKAELSKVPNDGKFKMNKEERSKRANETTLEALSRINSKR